MEETEPEFTLIKVQWGTLRGRTEYGIYIIPTKQLPQDKKKDRSPTSKEFSYWLHTSKDAERWRLLSVEFAEPYKPQHTDNDGFEVKTRGISKATAGPLQHEGDLREIIFHDLEAGLNSIPPNKTVSSMIDDVLDIYTVKQYNYAFLSVFG